ncbi:MAG: hypothetical protein ABSF15_21940 [Candidatus Sulfotelmatobacter sp.]|jgi:hypothetical protein
MGVPPAVVSRLLSCGLLSARWRDRWHPKGIVAGHQQEIQAERDRKLEAARDSGRIAASVTDETDYSRFDYPGAIGGVLTG